MKIPFKMYNEKGYVVFNEMIPYAINNNISFIIIIGGRGTGKTYGILKQLYEMKYKFFHIRRKQTQVDMLVQEQFNSFASINEDCGYNVINKKFNKLLGAYYDSELNEKGERVPAGPPIGLIGALSTFSSSRGIDGRDIKAIFFDEFLREPHENSMKNEGDIFANVYETLNRNRELNGQKPILAILASNENYSESDIMNNFHVYEYIDRMKENEVFIDKQRGVLFIYQKNSKISLAKSKTALYKAGASSRILDMAINNTSKEMKHRVINFKPTGKAWFSIDGIGTAFKMNRNGETIVYMTEFINGCKDRYGTSSMERARFLREKQSILYYDSIDRIYYQTVQVKMNLKEIIKGL